MKKQIMKLASLILLIGLVACSNNDTDRNQNSTVTDDAAETSENQLEENTEWNEEDSTNDNVIRDDQIESTHPLADYEEAPTIHSEIDVENLQVEEKVDTNRKRILLFTNEDHQKIFKTVYIKTSEQLKIIDIQHDNGEVFHEQIHL